MLGGVICFSFGFVYKIPKQLELQLIKIDDCKDPG